MSNFEPVYSALFDVILTPPDAITNETEWSSGKELLLENILSIKGLDVDIAPENTTQEFKGATRNFAGVIPNDTSVKFSITFALNLNDANQNYIYNAMRKWGDLIYDPLTATQTLKKTYVSPAGLSMTAFNKIYEVHRKIEIKNIYLAGPLPTYDKDYSNKTALEEMTVEFIGDYFNNAYA